jgi:hypothetical protein
VTLTVRTAADGTQADNIRDMCRKQRYVNVRGKQHPAVKLTLERVVAIH